MINNFVTFHLGYISITLFDNLIYLLINAAYTIFLIISRINIFSTSESQTLFNGFTQRLYSLLSIVMVFIFAYQLIVMIINPDGETGKKSTSLIKDTLISFIFIALCPWIFNQMALFQNHVLTTDSIPAIILGAQGSDTEKAGKSITMMMFFSMYHPVNTTYDTFFENGELLPEDTAINNCIKTESGPSGKVCEQYVNSLVKWKNSKNASIGPIARNGALLISLGQDDGMEYLWILSTICGIAVAWFFISYAIDLGTRAVKLAVLQIIAPIPLICRVFPQTKKTFETWFGEIKKTYLEVFIRVAIVCFVVYLCTLIPSITRALLLGATTHNFILDSYIFIFLLLGLLKFAKEAPELFKTLIDNGSNLFKGLNFKPGVRKRVEDNDLAMRGINTIAEGGAGAVGNVLRKYNYEKNRNPDISNKEALGRAVLAAPRGLITGGISGFKSKNKSLKMDAMGNVIAEGRDVAQASGAKADLKRAGARDAFENAYNNARANTPSTQPFAPLAEGIGNYVNTYMRDNVDDKIADAKANAQKRRESWTGQSRTTTAAGYQTLSSTNDAIKNIVEKTKGTKFKTIKETGDEALKALRTEGKTMWEGEEFSINSIRDKLIKEQVNQIDLDMRNYLRQVDIQRTNEINDKIAKLKQGQTIAVNGQNYKVSNANNLSQADARLIQELQRKLNEEKEAKRKNDLAIAERAKTLLGENGTVTLNGKDYKVKSNNEIYSEEFDRLDKAIKESKIRTQLKNLNATDAAGNKTISLAGHSAQEDMEKLIKDLTKNITTLAPDTIKRLESKVGDISVIKFLSNLASKTDEFNEDDIKKLGDLATALEQELKFTAKPTEPKASDSKEDKK